MSVGMFMIAGILSLGFISVKVGRLEGFGGHGYSVFGVFSESGGLRTGASVTIAGVDVGRVRTVALDNGQARVDLELDENVKLPVDSIASIKTRGLIGEKYVQITPGADEETIAAGGRLRETQPAIDLESLISKFAFGKM
jgi:phospholipid/cholesterol/gamma-HCH transport system substrate-binding protein